MYPRPCLTSETYCGLVELCFSYNDGALTQIRELSFVTILRSNLRLRVLEFSLNLTSLLPSDAPNLPVRLDDLGLLIVSTQYYEYLALFLRLISPRLKPLCIDSQTHRPISEWPPSPFSTLDNIVHFFARSTATQLYGPCLDNCAELVTKLVNRAPHLHILVL